MNEKMKTLTLVVMLSFTCFLTQCKGCLDVDNATNKLVPNQELYTLSCGFPAPYFDIKVLNRADESLYYTVADPGIRVINSLVNIAVMIGLFFLLSRLASRGKVRINRLFIITVIFVLLISSSILIKFFPEFLLSVFFYIYGYPVMAIGSLLDLIKLENYKDNISPRIYIVLLIAVFYYLVPAVASAKRRLSNRISQKG